MPRVNVCNNWKKNKIRDLVKFKKTKFAEHDLTLNSLAEPMDVTVQDLCYKFNKMKKEGKDTLKYTDLVIFFQVTKATDEEILKMMKKEVGQ